jgi:hypothetical protein
MKKLKTRTVRIDPHADCTGPHEIEQAKVGRFMEAKRTGSEFPPVRLVAYSGFFQIIDGHHRVEAHQMLEHSFLAIVVDGDEFEQLDIELREAGEGKRADDIEFWDISETVNA